MSEFFLELFSEEIPAGLQKNLREKILELTKNQELLENKKIKSREWVVEYHDISNVSQSLYSYYEKNSWIK